LNSNGEITAGRSLGIVDSSWEIAATGDYNGDGITDILWKNTPSGTVAQWLMKPDGSVASYQIVGNISNDWQIAKI
jgi:ribulose kinase